MSAAEGMRPVHWADTSRADTLAEARGRAALRKRFPGLDEQIGRAVGAMADHCVGERAWRVFGDVRPVCVPGISLAIGWTAHVIATGPAVHHLSESGEVRMPVIPDEFNPRPGGLIEPEDPPYQFSSMLGAEHACVVACDEMSKTLHNLLGAP